MRHYPCFANARPYFCLPKVAGALASSPQRLAGVRKQVEDARLEGALFDTQQWVKGFEKSLRLMWELAVAGKSGENERHMMHVVLAPIMQKMQLFH